MTLSLVIFSGIAILFLLKYLWDQRRIYYYSWKYKGAPAFPIIGCTYYFFCKAEDRVEKVFKGCLNYGPIFRTWLGNKFAIMSWRPKDLEIIANNCLDKIDYVYKMGSPVIGNGLLIADIDVWKQHRKIIQSAFKQQIVNSYVNIFAGISKKLIKDVEEKCDSGFFDILPYLHSATVEMICETSLGIKLDSLKTNFDIVHCLERLAQLMTYRFTRVWLHPDFLWNLSSSSKEFSKLAKELRDFVKDIISARDGKQSGIFIDHLIKLTKEDQEHKWTEEELIDETAMILTAATESTAIITSFVLTALGIHQDIQEEAFEEQRKIFSNSEETATIDEIKAMDYLERVIYETMRLLPVTGIVGRMINKDIELDSEHVVPKGAMFVLGILTVQRDPEIWEDPMKFDPDRFLPEERAKRHPYSYMPFSKGPRDCLGRGYAMLAMKTLISTFLRKYRIKSHFRSISEIKLVAEVVMKFVHKPKIIIEKRNYGK